MFKKGKYRKDRPTVIVKDDYDGEEYEAINVEYYLNKEPMPDEVAFGGFVGLAIILFGIFCMFAVFLGE